MTEPAVPSDTSGFIIANGQQIGAPVPPVARRRSGARFGALMVAFL